MMWAHCKFCSHNFTLYFNSTNVFTYMYRVLLSMPVKVYKCECGLWSVEKMAYIASHYLLMKGHETFVA